jgi:hypothetical protein
MHCSANGIPGDIVPAGNRLLTRQIWECGKGEISRLVTGWYKFIFLYLRQEKEKDLSSLPAIP